MRGGTLVFGINSGDPPTYDCHQSALFPIIHLLTPHYSNLLKIDTPNYPKLIGDLAESWTVADDAKTYTFKLHAGVKFHDGSPFSAEDIKASYDRIRNPPQGVVSVRQGLVADIDTIETPDPLTVIFRLKRPNRALIYAFANPFNCVYSAAKLKENPLFPVRNVLGTGPFRFVEHVAGSHWSGERFKDYFKPGLPYLDGFRGAFTQGAALINALQGGQIMADFRSVTTADRERLAKALGDKIVVQESPWLNALLITFNTTKKPFDDARVRRALSLAVDRWKAAEVLPRSSIMRYVGGYLRPGYELAATRGRPGADAGLRPRHRGLARRGEAPARRGRRAEPEGAAGQPHGVEPLRSGRHLRDRPVAPDRRRDRARAGERDALQQLDERRHVRRRARLPGRLDRRADLSAHAPSLGRHLVEPRQVHRPRARQSCSSSRRPRPIRRSATGCCASSRRAC